MKRLVVNDQCVSEEINNVLIILNISTGKYHELNEIGTIIWKQVKDHRPTKIELIKKIKEIFNDEDQALEEDCKLFLENLIKRELILLREIDD